MKRHCSEEEIIELARGRLTPDLSQATAAHLRECSDCAARLAGEEALAAELRCLAASQQAEQAPVEVETTLLAAFRSFGAPASRPAPGALLSGGRVWRTALDALAGLAGRAGRPRSQEAPLFGWLDWRRATVLAAASLALIVCLLLLRGRPPIPPVEAPNPALRARAGLEAGAPTTQAGAPTASARAGLEAGAPAAPARRARRPAPKTRPTPPDNRQPQTDSAGDFYTLPGTPAWALQDGVRLVRAEMPRSALVSFGLPVNAERAAQPISVDLIVSDDGVARAIRVASQVEERRRR